MIGEGIASILSILSALLEDRAKELLRRKTSDDKAKSLSFKLYKQVRSVTTQSRHYVRSLEDLAKTLRQHASNPAKRHKDFAETSEGGDIVRKALDVNSSIDLLTEELADLQEIMNDMATQLELHIPQLVKMVERFDLDRQESLTQARYYYVDVEWKGAPGRLRAEWPRYLLTCRDELWDLYVGASENQILIEGASEDLRGFLAAQFSFRESF